jgi:23S rRNA pseudouridine1911/1915/1917 synthase
MKKLNFKPAPEDKGSRLDQYLTKVLKGRYSRSRIQKLIQEQLVLVDDESAKAHLKLKGEENVELSIPPEKKETLEPENIKIDIVYEDNYLLVVNKGADMVVHPAPGTSGHTLVNALLNYTNRLSKVAGPLKPGIVHRLDKDTSGLLVIAKDDDVHRALAGQFKERTIKRKYAALVRGVIQLDRGLIDAPISRSQGDRKKMDINFLSKKDALTYYEVIRRFKNATLLELDLKTGRTHQIRIHLKYIGHPLIGDKQYGVAKEARRQMLHAKTLGFRHPQTNKYLEFHSQIPEDMKDYISRLK